MCNRKLLIISLCALVSTGSVAGSVVGRPQKATAAKSVILNEAINNTICPFEVTYDRDENRIPKWIKIIQCTSRAFEQCPVDVSDDECCPRYNTHALRECVQIEEWIPVKYAGSDTTIKVQMGCACMTRTSRRAVEKT